MHELWLGGRGANKALGRVLLEQNVDRQTCQRKAVNAKFLVKNPYSEWAYKCLYASPLNDFHQSFILLGVALEDEEDEEEGEGEEVMRALFVEEENDETDAESDGDAVEEVFELF